ncbi:MAPK regulated corepressor interacting protein 2 [Contarinia nasturtii]|uniref:MAPK regulated corepressor interacting protein 2 n=1 Tax=Contarinia nasturtii TaxID=265458 RepID=UPI0012D3DBB1|nr:MAPK regulated corepressor interacting protein 2 [Contarinia nasturtii]
MDRNNMRNQNSMPSGLPKRPPMPYLAQQHDELIRYIHDAWHKITEPGQHGTPTFYRNPPEQRLNNFQPFDLEKWWGHRAVQNYHNMSRGHQ